jgi:hypothetical protein
MSHEMSETIKGKDGRWYNVDTVGKDKGRVLGNKKGYSTVKEAVDAAKKRSKSFDKHKHKHSPKTLLEDAK